MIRLLQLTPAHGHKRLRAAVGGALACGSSDPATVMHQGRNCAVNIMPRR